MRQKIGIRFYLLIFFNFFSFPFQTRFLTNSETGLWDSILLHLHVAKLDHMRVHLLPGICIACKLSVRKQRRIFVALR